jgi:hypothetical protein
LTSKLSSAIKLILALYISFLSQISLQT